MNNDWRQRSSSLPRRTHRIIPRAASTAAALLLLLSLKLPLWQMRLEAPQYRDQEALNISVHPDALRGDLRELSVLDQYIGVHVPPTLPQFKWLPGVLLSGAILGLTGGLLTGAWRHRVLFATTASLIVILSGAALQARMQMHDIGHKRDQKTVLAGVHDFTPPFLGTSRIAQFTVSSRFGSGAWLVGIALTLQIGAAWLSRAQIVKRSKGDPEPPVIAVQSSPEFRYFTGCPAESSQL